MLKRDSIDWHLSNIVEGEGNHLESSNYFVFLFCLSSIKCFINVIVISYFENICAYIDQ